jgi:hypothetical protein
MLTDKLDCCSDAVEVSVKAACFVFDGVKFHNSLPLVTRCRRGYIVDYFSNDGAKVQLIFDICKKKAEKMQEKMLFLKK